MIVAFSGWRYWSDPLFVQRVIDTEWGTHLLFGRRDDQLLFRVGNAPGADAIITSHLRESGAAPVVYFPDYERYGQKAAPAIRNRDMLLGQSDRDPRQDQRADILFAFPQPGRIKPANESLEGGTWNAIKQAHFLGVEVRIPPYRMRDTARVETADYVQLMIGAQP